MKRVILLIGLVTLSGCTSEPPRQPAQPTLETPEPAAEEKPGNFTLYVSNQSFDRKTVDIAVAIDGKKVAAQNFEVKNQHNWIDFTIELAAGKHTLQAFSTAGSAQLTINFSTAGRHWAVVNYWCCGEPDDPKFTFDLSDQPLVFG